MVYDVNSGGLWIVDDGRLSIMDNAEFEYGILGYGSYIMCVYLIVWILNVGPIIGVWVYYVGIVSELLGMVYWQFQSQWIIRAYFINACFNDVFRMDVYVGMLIMSERWNMKWKMNEWKILNVM